MTTLVLSEIFPPQIGGSGRWLWELYRRLPREEFVIFAGEHPQQEAFDRTHDLRLRRIPLGMKQWGLRSFSGLRDYGQIGWQLRRAVKELGVRSVHCGRCLPEGWLAWMLNWATGIPYQVYVHGEDIEGAAQSREFRWMIRRVFSGAEGVIANSHNTARLLREGWNVSDHKLHVLHPGVDTARFVPAPHCEATRRSLGWENRSVVLTVSRLQKRKGHDQMIAALPEIRRHVPDVLFAIAGDGEERAALIAAVERGGVEEHVQFLGEVSDEGLVACYQQCDLFALPNRAVNRDIEGFGMVLVEAQACGKGVIAGASGGTAETMRVPETGRLVNCDGPRELAAMVAELLRDAPQRERMGLAARQWVVENFEWQTLLERARQIFRCSQGVSAAG